MRRGQALLPRWPALASRPLPPLRGGGGSADGRRGAPPAVASKLSRPRTLPAWPRRCGTPPSTTFARLPFPSSSSLPASTDHKYSLFHRPRLLWPPRLVAAPPSPTAGMCRLNGSSNSATSMTLSPAQKPAATKLNFFVYSTADSHSLMRSIASFDAVSSVTRKHRLQLDLENADLGCDKHILFLFLHHGGRPAHLHGARHHLS